MAKKEYKAVYLEEEFYNVLEEAVNNKRYGFTGVPELVREACRKYLKEIGQI